MLTKTLPFLRQILSGSLTQSTESLGLCRGPRQKFPSALALQRTLCEALLPCGPQQVATGITEAAFEFIVGARQARHVIAVKQAGPIAPADLVKVKSTRREGRSDIGPRLHPIKIAAPLLCHLLTPQRLRDRRFSDVRDVPEPGSALLEVLGGLRKGR